MQGLGVDLSMLSELDGSYKLYVTWLVGRSRHLGSLHTDRWAGTAAELAERGYIAVYPALGWWRERKHLNGWQKQARYALVVTISTPDADIDIYNTVATLIAAPVAIQLET